MSFKRERKTAFACGMTGSGKSHWLLHEHVAHEPRVIHIDPNGEFVDDPDVYMAAGWDATLDALQVCGSLKEWRIAVSLQPDDMARLFGLLAPVEGFGENSYARMVGGLAIETGEVQELAPNGRTDPRIAGAWSRGRHHRLTMLAGTQRVALCDRLVTSMSQVVAIFQQSEPGDVDRVRKQYGKFAAADVERLAPHWCVVARIGEQHYEVQDPDRRVVKRVNRLDGALLSRR